jgi:uncharacterized protein
LRTARLVVEVAHPALEKRIRGRLQDRVLFGCDSSGLGYERVVNEWIAEDHRDEILEKLFFRNADPYFGAAVEQ